MAESSQGFHEAENALNKETRDMHRALVSLQEELEAIDWYRQRADACEDQTLREVLLHNMREEVEHACMLLEWLRRNNAHFDHQLKVHLFSQRPIVEIEEAETQGNHSPAFGQAISTDEVGAPAISPFSVGSLKEKPCNTSIVTTRA
jgi:ferritin-like protein